MTFEHGARCPACMNWHSELGDAPAGCWRHERNRLRRWWQDYYARRAPRYRRQLLKALRRGWKDFRSGARLSSPYRENNYMAALDGAWGFGVRLARISRHPKEALR